MFFFTPYVESYRNCEIIDLRSTRSRSYGAEIFFKNERDF